MMESILRDDGALCLSGYPIRIERRRGSGFPFIVVSDWHETEHQLITLETAKDVASRLAREIDEMTPLDERETRGAS